MSWNLKDDKREDWISIIEELEKEIFFWNTSKMDGTSKFLSF